MFCDNQAAIDFSKSPIENRRTKHIDVRFHFLRNLIFEKQFYITHVNSKENLADIFTKPLSKSEVKKFYDHVFQ